MAYKLEAEVIVEKEESPLNKYLLPYDVVRGSEFEVFVILENVGESTFPGGNLDGGVRFETTHSELDDLPEISAIEPNKNDIVSFSFQAIETGRAGVDISISADDTENVLVSRPDTDRDRAKGFIETLYVVNREQLLILNQLADADEFDSHQTDKELSEFK